MTDEDGGIPKLEGSDSEEVESANMADDELCKCPGSKTKGIVKKNNNKCPQTNCGKKLTDIPGYDSDTEQKEPSRSEQNLKILTEWLDGLSYDIWKEPEQKTKARAQLELSHRHLKGVRPQLISSSSWKISWR